MSRTVSFRASEELDDFLEEEAERRLTTKSTAAQMLLAERVQQLQAEGSGDGSASSQSTGGASEEEGSGLPGVFGRYDDSWYRPDSKKNNFAVRLPGDGGTKYYKTQEGAAERLRKEFDE